MDEGDDVRKPNGGKMAAVQHAAAVVMLVLLVLSVHGHLLGFYFTGMDTLPHLVHAKSETLSDLLRVLTEPSKGKVISESTLYRPAGDFLYTVNYWLVKMNPMAYWVTNLFIHVGAVLALYGLVWLLDPGAFWTALGSASLFTLHPVMLDTLPVLENSHILLSTFALTAGLLVFHLARLGVQARRGLFILAGGFFLLAMGAKEVGFVFVPLVFLHGLLLGTGSRVRRSFEALKVTLPYALLAGGYLVWWLYVTGGKAFVGGGRSLRPPLVGTRPGATLHRLLVRNVKEVLWPNLHRIMQPGRAILRDLLPPGDYVGAYFTADPVPFVRLLALVLMGGLLVGVFLVWRRAVSPGRENADSVRRWVIPGLRTAFLGFLMIPAAYPVIHGFLQGLIESAYRGEAYPWIRLMMESREVLPLAYYRTRARYVLLVISGLGAGAAALLIVLVRGTAGRLWGQFIRRVRRRGGLRGLRAAAFYGAWILIVLVFYTLTRVSSWENLYVVVPPLCALTVTGLRLGGRNVMDSLSGGRGRSGGLDRTDWVSPGVAVIMGLFLVGVLRMSPLRWSPSTWREAQALNRQFYRQVKHQVDQLPPGSVVEFRRVPFYAVFRHRDRAYPHLEGSIFPTGLRGQEWLRLQFPGRDLKHGDWSLKAIERSGPWHVWIEPIPLGSHYFQLRAHWRFAGAGGGDEE